MFVSAVYLPSIYRGGKQRTQKNLTLPLYIPNFTLISDLVSDLGVTSGLSHWALPLGACIKGKIVFPRQTACQSPRQNASASRQLSPPRPTLAAPVPDSAHIPSSLLAGAQARASC